MSKTSITFERTIAAPPAHVYRAFTNGTSMREWLADVATTSPKEGGYWFLAWNDGHFASGRFTELDKNRRVALTWRDGDDGPRSRVEVDIDGRDGTSRLRVAHHDLDPSLAADYEHAWNASLDNLASVLAEGPDLRVTQRPMLGIFVGEFNERVAARLGVPVSEGIMLEDVVPGMGAAAAGLQKGDVVVEIGGQPTGDWSALHHALAQHKAGDTVDVTLYRNGAQQRVAMPLSGRPIPEIPPTADALADAVYERLTAAYRGYVEVLADVPDDVAARRPSPGEWSVNEILAHLIHGERGTARWIAELLGGEEPLYDGWGGNIEEPIAATAESYGSLQGLVDELDRGYREVTALIRRLPDEFVAQRGRYWRLAWSLLEGTTHMDTHLDQVKATIEQATERV